MENLFNLLVLSHIQQAHVINYSIKTLLFPSKEQQQEDIFMLSHGINKTF